MKVLGISAGRPEGNSEILLKEALKACEANGQEVTFIRLHDYYIKPCIGCEFCTTLLSSGKPPRCKYDWSEDDIRFLMDQIQASDGVIIAAPAYQLMPPGIITVVLNRIHSCGADNHTARANEGKNKTVCATIGVGGSDWVSLLLPLLNLMTTELIGSQMRLVDQMEVHGIPLKGMAALMPKGLERARLLGENVCAELGKPQHTYHGTQVEVCPICHSNLLEYRKNGRVACPFCDVEGDVIVEDGKMTGVKWDGGIEVSRWSKHGTAHHDNEMEQGTGIKRLPGHRFEFSDEHKKTMSAAIENVRNTYQPLKPPARG